MSTHYTLNFKHFQIGLSSTTDIYIIDRGKRMLLFLQKQKSLSLQDCIQGKLFPENRWTPKIGSTQIGT